MNARKPALLAVLLATLPLAAEEDLGKKLSNPVSDLVSVPIQSNFDFGIGPGDGTRWTTNVQPVAPFNLNDRWNLITRTIMPIIEVEGTALTDAGDASGLGDILQTFFLSPTESAPIWGIGPALLYPSATDPLLGGEKWAAGPSAVVLKQTGPWTYGALANHLWDYDGDPARNDVNATFIQPFLAYNTPGGTTFTLNSESTYDWVSEQWTIPLNFMISQISKIGSQPVQYQVGARYYAEAPTGGPEWGVRASLIFLFPKGAPPAPAGKSPVSYK